MAVLRGMFEIPKQTGVSTAKNKPTKMYVPKNAREMAVPHGMFEAPAKNKLIPKKVPKSARETAVPRGMFEVPGQTGVFIAKNKLTKMYVPKVLKVLKDTPINHILATVYNLCTKK